MEGKEEHKIQELEDRYFDIGLAGVWYGTNYGSVMTYYALHQTLVSMGYSVLMIDKLKKVENDFELNPKIHSRVFAAKHYKAIAPSLTAGEMKSLNRYCGTFLMGCDQVWNYGIARNFGLNNYFDYVEENKKKLSYASSFGHNVSFTPKDKMSIVTKLFHRFDHISVREAEAVLVLKNEFGKEATQVVDPVFLLKEEDYETVLSDSKIKESEKYLLSYILDPTPEIREMLLWVAEKKGLRLINMIDGRGDRKKNKEILNLPDIVENLDAPTWLWYIKNAEFVITDSCHGASFSLIFQRPFIAIANKKRGVSRFESLVDLFDIRKRYVYEVEKIKETPWLLEDMDYSRVQEIMIMERERSLAWLKEALMEEKLPPKTVEQTVPKKECCGCGACYNSCPTDAITMEYDREGFLYPVIDHQKCILCTKCCKVCPSLHPYTKNKKEPDCYAAYASNEIQQVSSSGGIFSVVAEEVLEQGGVVCGAAFDENFTLSHRVVKSKEELSPLRGSKYVHCDTKNTYKEIKEVLNQGKPALFAGCGCHVAGLRGFLGKDYENLYTIDLLCHGGPSPKAFEKYLKEVHDHQGKKKITYVGFRDKDHYKWGINATGMTVKYEKGQPYRKMKFEDLFYRAFTPGIMARPHCHCCNFATLPRQGDFTLGDFWGVEKYNPSLTNGGGTSIVSVNNEKGEKLLEKIQSKLSLVEPIDRNHILTHGQPYGVPAKNNPRRHRFLRMLEQVSFQKSVECCEKNTFDVAIVGMNDDSYGEILGYYGLYLMIAKMDYSVLMVKRPREFSQRITPLKYRLTEFGNRHYPLVSGIETKKGLKKLRDSSRVAIVEKIRQYTGNLEEMDSVLEYQKESEESSFDKVFLAEKEDYEKLLSYAKTRFYRKYMVWDFDILWDNEMEKIEEFRSEFNLMSIGLRENMMVEDWLYTIKNAMFIVSDKVEVLQFAMIFQIPFIISSRNMKKSHQKYLKGMGLKEHFWKEEESLENAWNRVEKLNYQQVNDIIVEKRVKIQKDLEKSLKKVQGTISRRENPLWRKCARKGIVVARRVLPASVQEKLKKFIKKAKG